MAKVAAKKTEVIPVEANKPTNGIEVIEAIPMDTPEEILEKVEKEISTTLVKRNITDAILAELNVKYKDLKINGQEDKDGFEAVHEARMTIARTRVQIKAICEGGRELSVAIQKKWIATQKELTERIQPEENRLKKMEDDYTAEKERLKFEKLEMQKNRLRDRMRILLAMGATSDGVDVSLDDISFSQTDIREADEEDWLDDILPEYKTIFDKKETIRLENERVQKELKDKQDQEKEQFEEEKRKFEQEKKELEDQKKEAALQKRNARIAQVEAIGMRPIHPSGDYVYLQSVIASHVFDPELYNDANWNVLFKETSDSVDYQKKEQEKEEQRLEDKRLEDARIKAAAELKVKERVAEIRGLGYVTNQYAVSHYNKSTEWSQTSDKCVNSAFIYDATDEEWAARIISLKAHIESEDKRVAQENKDRILKEENDRKENLRLQQLEDSEKASDSVKWDIFVNQVNALVLPTMKRQPYKDYVEIASGLIKKINAIKK